MVSLTQSQRIAISGMKTNQEAIEITTANVANYNVKGYSRKVIAEKTMVQQGQLDSVGAGVMMGNIRRQVDERLLRDYRDAGTQKAYYDRLNDLHTRLQTTFGKIGEKTDFAVKVSSLAAALSTASQNTASSVNRQVILNAANDLITTVQHVTTDLQGQRSDADQQIQQTLLRINQLSQEIHQTNVNIYSWQASGYDTTDLQDTRDRAVSALSELINIQVAQEPNGAFWISTSSGLSLVDNQAYPIIYAALPGEMTPAISYANGSFQAIELLGQDLTTLVTGGKLKGLIDQRDQVLPDLQSQVNAFVRALRDNINQIHNLGSVFPGAKSLTSTHQIASSPSATASTQPQWSGSVRVAVVDARGLFSQWADIDLSTVSTIGEFVTTLNASLGFTAATIKNDGSLTLSAPSGGYGIAVGDGCSGPTSVPMAGQVINFSHYFGFNDFFVTPGNTVLDEVDVNLANTLAIRPDIATNPSLMALSRLSQVASPSAVASADMAARGALSSGDSSIVTSMWGQIVNTEISFGAAGSLGAVTTTFVQYGGVIVSHNAVQAKYTLDNQQYYKRLRDQLEQNVLSVSGVNVDMELQRGEEYRDSYAALARVFQTAGRMMDEVLSLPRR